MNLFTKISGLLSVGSSISITIKRSNKDNKLHVLVAPKIESTTLGDKGLTITPIIFKGEPEDLDKNFLDNLINPLFKFNETALSISQMEKDLEAIKESAKKSVSNEKTKTTKTNNKVDPKKIKEELVAEEDIKDDTEETEDDTTEEVTENIIEDRPAYLKALGFEFDKVKLSYVKGSASIGNREVKLLNEEQFHAAIKRAEEESKIQKPEGSAEVNAFTGNADKVGVKNISKEKEIKANSETIKASKPVNADTPLPAPEKKKDTNQIEFF